ncbi:MAG: flavin reductase family protein [Planctomycetota bacterium]|jgi:flavin reductase (DIM6/NTAB) family NADH-FMN oxidoreductase RutF|nr:flavin reductase family protein [Planctomycetota bacterium]
MGLSADWKRGGCQEFGTSASTPPTIALSSDRSRMMARKTLPKQVAFPLNRAFTFVESGPVLLISTRRRDKINLMTASCHASMGFEPTLGICLGPWNFSYAALEETGECVVAIPPAGMLEKVVAIGNCSGGDTDKFSAFGLTPMPARKVQAPLVAECLYNLECRVVNRELVSVHNFFILQGVWAWRNPSPADARSFHAVGDGTFIIDGETVNLRHKMTKWQDCI